jgi:hypothetical protein
MMKFWLAAVTAFTMTLGVTFAQSSTTTSPGSSTPVSAATSQKSAQPPFTGNGVVGQFWTSIALQFPTRGDDVPKTVDSARQVSETASR